jgi:hypothetical protein
MADNEWVGKRFVARCLMHLPDQGEKRPGDEFTFTAACAALGLQPESWLKIGNAALVGKAMPKPGPSREEKPRDEPKPKPDVNETPVVADVEPTPPVVAYRKRGE